MKTLLNLLKKDAGMTFLITTLCTLPFIILVEKGIITTNTNLIILLGILLSYGFAKSFRVRVSNNTVIYRGINYVEMSIKDSSTYHKLNYGNTEERAQIMALLNNEFEEGLKAIEEMGLKNVRFATHSVVIRGLKYSETVNNSYNVTTKKAFKGTLKKEIMALNPENRFMDDKLQQKLNKTVQFHLVTLSAK